MQLATPAARYSDAFVAVAHEVGLAPHCLHAATASLLYMDVEKAGFRNMIRDIGKQGFARTQTVGEIRRVILGYLVSH